jgi:hypothetical protein
VYHFKLTHFLWVLFPVALFFDPAFLTPLFGTLFDYLDGAEAPPLLAAAAFGALLIALDLPAALFPPLAAPALCDLLATCPLAKVTLSFLPQNHRDWICII